MFLDAEIQKRFPIYENARWYVIALLWMVVDIAVLYCGYIAYVLAPRNLTFDEPFSWHMVLRPLVILMVAFIVFLVARAIARRNQNTQDHMKHERHLLKTGLKDVMWVSICFVLVFSFLDTGFVPIFYFMGMHTYAGVYEWMKFAIPALVHLIFFNGLLYYFRKTGVFVAYYMLFLLLLMALRGDLSLQTLGDSGHYFGEWASIAVLIYISMYIIPFYIWSFMSMAKDLKSPYFQIHDLHLVKNNGRSMAFNDIKTVKVINWFAIFGMYGIQCATDIKSIPLLQRGLLLFWFDKETAYAFKDYLQVRTFQLHAK